MLSLRLDTVAHFARTTPDKLAMHDLANGIRLTYAQLNESVDRAAHVLSAALAGNPMGKRVAVLSRNSALMLIVHFACARTASIFVPLNWRLSASEIAFLLEDCEPSVVLFEDLFADRIGGFGKSGLLLDDSADGLVSRMRAVPQPAMTREPAIDGDSPLTLLYSSGTTGKPKGVIVTHLNAFSGSLNLALGTNTSADSVFLCDMPLFHTAGLFGTSRTPLLMGGTVIISQKFDSQVTYDRLADPELGITHYFCVTQMAMMMRQLPDFDGRRLAKLTALITGGAPNPEAHILRWLDDGVMMINGWGMSEVCSALAQPVGSIDRIRAHAAAVGLPHLTVDIKLVNAAGGEVGRGEPGEIWIRGSNVTPGYWRRPDLDATAFVDGWFRTGDVAVQDSDGFYTIVDRIKDMFISGGENVYPAEIEAILIELESVTDAAVVGIPDSRWGEVGCAFVVTAAGSKLEASALEAHCSQRLAKYKVPKRFEILESLPRTPSGKVQKHVLRDQLAAGLKRAATDAPQA